MKRSSAFLSSSEQPHWAQPQWPFTVESVIRYKLSSCHNTFSTSINEGVNNRRSLNDASDSIYVLLFKEVMFITAVDVGVNSSNGVGKQWALTNLRTVEQEEKEKSFVTA